MNNKFQTEFSFVEIYKPQIEEWEKLKEIKLESLKKEPNAFRNKLENESSFPKEKWQEQIRQTKDNVLLFAKENEKIVGMIGMYNENGAAHIWGVYVSNEHRGKGIGKKLLMSIINEVEMLGYSKTELTVHASQMEAISIYKSFGFLIAEVRNSENVERYFMNKEL